MNCRPEDLVLYAVTDRRFLNDKSLTEAVEESLRGGVTFLQLREKRMKHDAFRAEALAVKAVAARYHVPLVIDDDVLLAKEIHADGVHLGRSDMAVAEARRILGADKIIGASARTVEDAVRAARDGADYLGSGAVFPTASKADAAALSHETLRAITHAVPIPVVAIGGITAENVGTLQGSGIAGVAVIRAVFGSSEIRAAAKELKEKVQAIL